MDVKSADEEVDLAERLDSEGPRRGRSLALNLVKWSIAAIVLYFVGRRCWDLWETSPAVSQQIGWGWLGLAGLFYVAAWIPAACFWLVLLRAFQHRAPLSEVVSAYMLGQIGKYVPGKGTVLYLRAMWLKKSDVSRGLAALTAAYETLIGMAGSLVIAVGCLPWLFKDLGDAAVPQVWQVWLRQPGMVVGLLLAAILVTSPVLLGLVNEVVRLATRRLSDRPVGRLTSRLMWQGLGMSSLSWLAIGLSWACTLQAVGIEWAFTRPIEVLGSVTFATFAGFLAVFAPGGLGVREWLLVECLREGSRSDEDGTLIQAALLLRGVWLVAEVVAAVVIVGWSVWRGKRN